jgi:translation initiation factor IF-2
VTSPIRPQFTPPAAPRTNARAAFFQAASGQAAAPASSAPAPAAARTEAARPAVHPRAPQAPAAPSVQAAAAAPPEKILRPGSLLDIKV